jgi:hypothetical protein
VETTPGLQTPSQAQGIQIPRTNNISASPGKHGTYSSNATYAFAQRLIRLISLSPSLSPSIFMIHGMPLFKKKMHSETALELDTTQTQKDPRDLNGSA